MSIGIFIEYQGQVVQFPVNPSKLSLVRDSNNRTTEIVQLGEINRLGINRLAEISLESQLPEHSDHSFVQTGGNFKSPTFYVDFIERIRRDQSPCRFIVSGTKINMLASIEAFEFEYRAGEGTDTYFSLELKEHRNHGAKEVKMDLTGSIPSGKPAPPPAPPSVNKQPTIGSTVIVNGRLHRDSFGGGPGLTEVNATRKINFHRPGRSHPFHVTLEAGGWRGWITPESITRVL